MPGTRAPTGQAMRVHPQRAAAISSPPATSYRTRCAHETPLLYVAPCLSSRASRQPCVSAYSSPRLRRSANDIRAHANSREMVPPDLHRAPPVSRGGESKKMIGNRFPLLHDTPRRVKALPNRILQSRAVSRACHIRCMRI